MLGSPENDLSMTLHNSGLLTHPVLLPAVQPGSSPSARAERRRLGSRNGTSLHENGAGTLDWTTEDGANSTIQMLISMCVCFRCCDALGLICGNGPQPVDSGKDGFGTKGAPRAQRRKQSILFFTSKSPSFAGARVMPGRKHAKLTIGDGFSRRTCIFANRACRTRVSSVHPFLVASSLKY